MRAAPLGSAGAVINAVNTSTWLPGALVYLSRYRAAFWAMFAEIDIGADPFGRCRSIESNWEALLAPMSTVSRI